MLVDGVCGDGAWADAVDPTKSPSGHDTDHANHIQPTKAPSET